MPRLYVSASHIVLADLYKISFKMKIVLIVVHRKLEKNFSYPLYEFQATVNLIQVF